MLFSCLLVFWFWFLYSSPSSGVYQEFAHHKYFIIIINSIIAMCNPSGLVKDDANGVTLALDGMPYTTMAYANGPGGNGLHNNMTGRQNLSDIDTSK